MRSITLSSPAKLNLFLKVLNKRPDGFHNILTIFERIDLSDKIHLTLNSSGDIRVRCADPHVPSGPRNLVYQAAKRLKEDFKIKDGVNIDIQKNIPVAAGLAGGSSNAATVLQGLNRLWRLDLGLVQLLPYAKELGSDVTFFMYDYSWGLGSERGDSIQKLDVRTKLWHVLVVPCAPLYSREVYGELRLPQGKTGHRKVLTKVDDNVSIFIHHLRQADISAIGQGLVNDLEAVVLRLFPALEGLKQRLKSLNTQGVMVSGSGPCVFGITETHQKAKDIQNILSRRFRRTFVARTN